MNENRTSLKSLIIIWTLLSLFSSLTFADELINIPTVPTNADCDEPSEIIPTCLNGRQRPMNAVELIQGDLKVCRCLDKYSEFFEDIPREAEPTSDQVKQKLLAKHSTQAGNASVLQAGNVVLKKAEMDKSVLVYGGQEIRGELKKTSSSSSVHEPKISEAITTINKIPKENLAWQCITYQEYSVQREIPTDNQFFKALQLTNSFEPKDWNVSSLKDKYDSASDADREKIRLRLVFLSRNPIFESIFKAIPSERFPEAKIKETQTQLFNILKLLSPAQTSTCFESANACLSEVRNSPAFEQYSDQVGRFILNDDVIDISSGQATADYMAELQRIMAMESPIDTPSGPVAYFQYLQSSNRDISQVCSGQTVDASCYTKFDRHCSQIRKMDKRVVVGMKENSADLGDILREEKNNFVSMDPGSNADFTSFNDKICNEPYGNAGGEKLTYFQFQEKICKTSPAPECGDRRQLLGRYLNEYSAGQVPGDQNLRNSFRSIVSKDAPLAISEAQVAAANNVSESPSELRARFGGRIPEISSKGKLVPSASGRVRDFQSNVNNSVPESFQESVSGGGSGSIAPTQGKVNNGKTSALARSERPSSLAPETKTTAQDPQKASSKKARAEQALLPVPRSGRGVSEVNPQNINAESPIPNQEPSAVNPEADRNVASSLSGGSGGGSSGVAAPSVSASSGASSGGSVAEGGSVGISSSGRIPRPANGQSLLFKYGLDKKERPEVVLISRDQKTSINVTVDRSLLERIRNNPNALEVSEEEWKKIFESADESIPLTVKSKGSSEGLTVYARKDGFGGLSFSLVPAASGNNRNAVRVEVLSDVYDLIKKNPNVYLNQNDLILKEMNGKDVKTIEVVSPGKPSMRIDVIKEGDFYKFRAKK